MSAKQYGRLEAPRPAEQKTVGAARRSESRPLVAFVLALLAGLSFISLIAYEPGQPFFLDHGYLEPLQLSGMPPSLNPVGQLGATFAVLALNGSGWGAFFIPFGLAVFAYYALFNRAHAIFPWKTVFLTLAVLSFVTLMRMVFRDWSADRFTPAGIGSPKIGIPAGGGCGGSLGIFLYDKVFYELLGGTGSLLVLGLVYAVSFCGIFVDDPRLVVARLMESFRVSMERRREEQRIRKEAMLEVRRVQVEALAEARKKIGEAKAKGASIVMEKTDKAEKLDKSAKAKKADTDKAVLAGTAAAVSEVGAPLAAEEPELFDDSEPDVAAPGVAEFGEAAKKAGTEPLVSPSAAVSAGAASSRPAGYGVMSAPEPIPLSEDDLDMDAEPDHAAEALTPTFSFALTGGKQPADAIGKHPVDTTPVADTPATPVVADRPAALPATPKAVPQAVSSGKLTIVDAEQVERVSGSLTPKMKGDYRFPPVTLLAEPPPADKGPAENYEERAEALVRTLGEFKIKVTPGDVQTGPVITRYEVLPAAGVRVEKISGLANNIAMNLKAESVRVLAPVPGKGTVGIEVPNRRPKAVSLREIIESKVWAENKCDIPVVLGKDVTGKPIVADLAKMPHALIAGSTGSGKSVCINGIIASLLYHASPDDLRFIMVDPKVVEMQIYNKLPHMLIPVVTDCKKVPGALKWLITEMERRYRIFAKCGVKNIAGFNGKLAKDKDANSKSNQLDLSLSPEERQAARDAVNVARDDGVLEIPDKKLPYIVCIIDELADLMMVAPADIETGIARIAQLARAAGIHLILATQRPSVNVITGVIKANLPCRIAFKVTSVIDSRTILDCKGAETLIGKGDMLFIPPGAASLVRAQGAYVSEEEVAALVDYINEQNGDPEFADDVQEAIEMASMEDGDDDGKPTEGTDDPAEDPMIAKSWDIIRSTKRASTSMLQRRLSIGYNRAARIMDILQERGYVGPENGSSPREILKEV
jgi:S-DNA-T family DNA segregation ATPase FtsK/SpoIIIE